jgi:hypothetical protein
MQSAITSMAYASSSSGGGGGGGGGGGKPTEPIPGSVPGSGSVPTYSMLPLPLGDQPEPGPESAAVCSPSSLHSTSITSSSSSSGSSSSGGGGGGWDDDGEGGGGDGTCIAPERHCSVRLVHPPNTSTSASAATSTSEVCVPRVVVSVHPSLAPLLLTDVYLDSNSSSSITSSSSSSSSRGSSSSGNRAECKETERIQLDTRGTSGCVYMHISAWYICEYMLQVIFSLTVLIASHCGQIPSTRCEKYSSTTIPIS